MGKRYEMRDVQNAPPSRSNKGSRRFIGGVEYQTQHWDVLIVCPSLCVCVCVSVHARSWARLCRKTYLALATHSMIASFLPMVTLVFLGEMMIDGAMGSAGPPTSRMEEKGG